MLVIKACLEVKIKSDTSVSEHNVCAKSVSFKMTTYHKQKWNILKNQKLIGMNQILE